MSEEIKAGTRRFVEEVWNRGNLALVDQSVAAECVYRGPAWDVHDPEGFKKVVTASRSAFPDLHLSIDDIIGEGDKVVTRWILRGTHKGDLMGIAPTGKQVTIWGINIERNANGKRVEEWEAWDVLGLMQQLGVIPPRGER